MRKAIQLWRIWFHRQMIYTSWSKTPPSTVLASTTLLFQLSLKSLLGSRSDPTWFHHWKRFAVKHSFWRILEVGIFQILENWFKFVNIFSRGFTIIWSKSEERSTLKLKSKCRFRWLNNLSLLDGQLVYLFNMKSV